MHFKSTYTQGLFAEFLARQYLRLHGFKILSKRYITGKNTNRAEIDIIAQKKGLSEKVQKLRCVQRYIDEGAPCISSVKDLVTSLFIK